MDAGPLSGVTPGIDDSVSHRVVDPGAAHRPVVTLDGASRSFGNTHAVRNVTLDLATTGTLHALVGENGAGKSTCLGMGAGRIPPSSGRVLIDGQETRTASPRLFIDAGVYTIYQELTIIPALSPEANVFLGKDLTRGGWLQTRAMARSYRELCERIGVAIPAAAAARDLQLAHQQMLEILRAISSNARAILLDEPTASLGENEREALFRTLDGLRKEGIALTLVSHNLDEVLAHSDDVTVFRDGQVIEARPAAEWSKRELVSAMLGNAQKNIDLAANVKRARTVKLEQEEDARQRPLLVVSNLNSPSGLRDVSFELRPGEILGVAGLVGSGRTEVLRALAGLDPAARGVVRVQGTGKSSVPGSVRDARERGIALLPEDRKGQGLVLGRSAADNVSLGALRQVSRAGWVSTRRIEAKAGKAAEGVGFDPARIGQVAGTFSGGNQQKLMLARWLFTDHAIMLADEPTRGVDVGAKAEILQALERMVQEGRSMIVVSSDLEEVVGIANRVVVMSAGRMVGLLDSAEGEITPAKILQLAFHSEDVLETRSEK